MSKQVMISLLRQGNTGNEILSILDAMVSDQTDTNSVTPDPTLDPIEF